MMELNPKSMTTQQRLHLMRMAEAVLVKDSKNVESLSNIGMLLLHERRYTDASTYLKRATALKKKDEKLLRAYGDALFKSAQYSTANKIRRKLVELKPRNSRFLADYAESLQYVGKTEQVTIVYDRLMKLEPNNPDVMNKKAMFLRYLGKYDEANALLKEIQDVQAGHPESLYLYCNSRKFMFEEAEEYDAHIQSALENNLESIAVSHLKYAGGKIWSDCGEYDKAFAYYKKANDVRLGNLVKNFATPFLNAADTFDKKFLDARSEYGDSTKLPVFILGMCRSGTTLVESVCAAHNDVQAGDELLYMQNISRSLGMESSAHENFKKTMNAYSAADIANMAKNYLGSVEKLSDGSKHLTDKLPHNFMNVGLIRLLYPKAKIIHCRRHPIDNCLSIYSNSMSKFHQEYKSDLTTLGLYYRQYWRLMQHWRDSVKDVFHEVYYEDMVVNTELNSRKLIEYLDLEWEEGVMNREGSQKAIKTLSSWQARQPVYSSSSGRWRKYEKHLGPLIDALGPVVEAYESELTALQT